MPVIGLPVPAHGAEVAQRAATVTTVTTITITPADVTPPPSPPSTTCQACNPISQRNEKTPTVKMPSPVSMEGAESRQSAAAVPSRSGGWTTASSLNGRGGTRLRRALKRTVSRFIPTEGSGRTYSYASLNDHLLAQSLTKSWARKDWKSVARILFGWTLNIAAFLGLCLCFSLYGCEIYANSNAAQVTGRELLLSWGWSIFQRFIVNEPALILAGKGLPILFSTAFCANVCGESIANMLGLAVSGVVTCLKQLRTGG